MGHICTQPIDGTKLRNLICEKAPNMSQASQTLGFCGTFLKNVCDRGSITPSAMRLIELEYGITPDQYKAQPKPEPEPEPEPELTPETFVPGPVMPMQPELREIDVEMAVFHGIMRAVDYLQEDVQALVYKAIYGALKKINADKEGSVKVSA